MIEPLRSIAQLVAEARAVKSDERRDRCLTMAAEQASTSREWDEILRRVPLSTPRELQQSLVARAIDSAGELEEIWGYRRAAMFQVQWLDDQMRRAQR